MILLVLIAGCTKIKRTYMLKGKWSVDNFTINGGEENMIAAFFPEHEIGNGKKVLSFSDQGVLKSEYYLYNQIDSVIYGTWEMYEHDKVYIKAGTIIDADFKVKTINPTKAVLYTESNFIEFYQVGNVSTIIEISKVKE